MSRKGDKMRSTTAHILAGFICILAAAAALAEITGIQTPPSGTSGQLQYNSRGTFGAVSGSRVSGSRVDITSAAFGADGSKSTFTAGGSLDMPAGATVDGVDVSALALSTGTASADILQLRADVNQSTAAIAVDTATLGADLAAEVAARLAGDALLGNATGVLRADLTLEAGDRQSQDLVIGVATAAESAARLAGDSLLGDATGVLRADLTAEAAARGAQDLAIGVSTAAETVSRLAGDSILGDATGLLRTDLTSESGTRQAQDLAIGVSTAAEASTRDLADTILAGWINSTGSALTSEIITRAADDGTLLGYINSTGSALTSEIARAVARDDEIGQSTGSIAGAYVQKAGDTMTGSLAITGAASTLTVAGNAFSVGGATLAVKDGRVGIGTSNPADTVEVKGNLVINSTTTSLYSHPLLVNMNNGSPVFAVHEMGSGNGYVSINTPLHEPGYDFRVQTSTFIIKNGAIGIGMTNPGAPDVLVIDGSNTQARFLAFSESGAIKNEIGRVGSGYVTTHRQSDMELATTPTADITFWPGASESVVFDRSGKVGIGNTAPATTLHVAGDAQFGSGAVKSTATTDGAYVFANRTSAPAVKKGAVYFDSNGDSALKVSLDGATFVSLSTGGGGGGGISEVISNISQFSGTGVSGNALTLLSSSVTLQGNNFNGAAQLAQFNASSQYPANDGSLIAGLNASSLGLDVAVATTAIAGNLSTEITDRSAADLAIGVDTAANTTAINAEATTRETRDLAIGVSTAALNGELSSAHSTLDSHTVATSTHGATEQNTAARIVLRDSAGGFAAGSISVSSITTNSLNGIINNRDPRGWYQQDVRVMSSSDTSVYLGYLAGGQVNAASLENTFIGDSAGQKNTNAYQNTYVGRYAGRNNTTGGGNLGLGYQALIGPAGGSTAGNMSCIGAFACAAATTATETLGIGNYAAHDLLSGYQNTNVGVHSGHRNTTGNGNTTLGYQAGYYNVTGGNNVMLGNMAGLNELGGDKLYIANSGTNAPLIKGDFSAVRVGISTGNPLYTFHVQGDAYSSGQQIVGSTLTVKSQDAAGYSAAFSSGVASGGCYKFGDATVQCSANNPTGVGALTSSATANPLVWSGLTQTTFGPCISGSTLTLTLASTSKIEATFAGSVYNNATSSVETGAQILVDGAFIDGCASPFGNCTIAEIQTNASAYSAQNLSFSIMSAPLSAGSHSVCLSIASTAGATSEQYKNQFRIVGGYQ